MRDHVRCSTVRVNEGQAKIWLNKSTRPKGEMIENVCDEAMHGTHVTMGVLCEKEKKD